MTTLYSVIVNRRTIEHDGMQRRFTEVLPDDPAPDAPVILFLHGSLQSGSVTRRFTGNTFDTLADRGCTVIYPDGVERHFNDHRVGFQEQARQLLIDDSSFLSSLLPASRGPIIGCGFSNGGAMIQRFALERPGVLDGIACFGSAWPTDDNLLPEVAALIPNWVPVPVLSVQGTADPLVPYEGGHSGIGDANRGTARSAIESARFFAELNGLNPAHHTSASLSGGGVRVDRFGPGVPGSPARADSADTDSAGSPQQAAPVELWSIEGMGHLVPSPKKLDEKIGPGTDKVVGAELVTRFFGL
ncbi:polyhydroxybutyrate depolymerase [Corynebacterium appendicis CIP 107643]|uniref:Polyhydroxybutyrate depolymerase n=1 Tax=Corynebacterium appendicis CIP 107643 TaxID=1161099 RepID=A0A1N7J6E2_9CORY|nr:Alpha/beta hydrolase family protein [Corynebacterium appendicis CIP 107643]SIS44879.1 polyhydroxybutyrate depolymerase [Corynebacterium appendicis CIP 107643]